MSRSNELLISQVKTMLFMISNAMIVHESLVATGALRSVKPLASIDYKDPVSWLRREWEEILNTDYRPIFEPAKKLLLLMPSNPIIFNIIRGLANVARRAVGNRAVFRHDLAGRLYHRLLLKDVAKGLATYYTSIPASVLLACLSLDLLQARWEDIESIRKLRIVDLACGSGTLLSAVYSEIMDRHILLSQNPMPSDLHKVLLENVLFGFDVLEYAIHLASSTLVLRRPEVPVSHTNTFVLPLGVINDRVYLGSLDFEVDENEMIFPIIRPLFGSFNAELYRATISDKTETSTRFDRPNMIIMNPPFSRTGNVGKSTLFGHLPEADRKEVLDKLNRRGDYLRRILDLEGGFGRAGLAAFFVLQAFRAIKQNGVLALVLPRVFLSGSDWTPVRKFLVDKGKIEHIIISDDPDGNYAWSENTVLSEILLTYTKRRTTDDDYTIVVFVRRKPSSALEAKIYANIIKEAQNKLYLNASSTCSSHAQMPDFTDTKVIYIGSNPALYIYGVKYSNIKKSSSTNLNIVAGFHNSLLSSIAFKLFFKNELDGGLRIPLTPISEFIKKYVCSTFTTGQKSSKYTWENYVGYDVAGVRRNCLQKGNIPVAFLSSLSSETFSRLKLPKSALLCIYTNPKCYARAGKLLIPGVARFRLNTVRVVASYFDEPVLSQVAWTIPLNDDDAKIQVLWLNSTLGLIHFLSLRQDSHGALIQLKKKLLGQLLFIDINNLSQNAKRELINFFDKYSNQELENIRNQLIEAQRKTGYRYELDRTLIKALCGVDLELDKALEQKLLFIYKILENENLLTG